MTELDQLTSLFSRLGATPGQAETMAAQLLKRAEQLAVDRGMDRTSALSYLVEVVMKGRSGEIISDFPPRAIPQKPPATDG